jgi:hypothetical protein
MFDQGIRRTADPAHDPRSRSRGASPFQESHPMNRSARRAAAAFLAAAYLFAAAAGPATAAGNSDDQGNLGNAAAAQADHKPVGSGSGRKIG